MKLTDFYGVLGVECSVSADEIKRAYRVLAHKYHPDVSDDPDGERKFKEIGEAYQALKLPELRSAYDRALSRTKAMELSQIGNGAWLTWLLWLHWWKSWEGAWSKASETLE